MGTCDCQWAMMHERATFLPLMLEDKCPWSKRACHLAEPDEEYKTTYPLSLTLPTNSLVDSDRCICIRYEAIELVST